MTLLWLYVGSVFALLLGFGALALAGVRRRAFRPLSLSDLATAAILICLLHVAVVPWQIGLAKIPGLDALIFSIPYTAVFLWGLRLVPKPGIAALLIFGEGLFGQLLGRGINPAWWPYYLWCALGVEMILLVVGAGIRTLPAMLAAGVVRGLLAYSYMYLILAPFLWRQFYAPWYVAVKISMGMIGCIIGAVVAWRLGPTIEKAARPSSL